MSDYKAAKALALLAFILLIYSVGLMVNRATELRLTPSRWECTVMTYPLPEKHDMFKPYCSQYTAKDEEEVK